MKKTIEDLCLKNKRVLLRADFNVPLCDGVIDNDKRIREEIPTIQYILEQGASVVVCSHLGRPNGVDKKFSLKPVAKRLGELLGKKVKVIMAKDVVGEDANAKAKALKPGQVLVLENLRFEKGEEENKPAFVKKLAKLGDVFVFDAFGTAHRSHASTVGLSAVMPSAVGYLVNKELEIINGTLKNPERPFVGILGGSKVKDKIKVINNLLDKVDVLMIGGGMAYTFIKALGGNVGASIVDEDSIELASELMQKAQKRGVNFILPVDNVCAKEISPVAKVKKSASFEIPEGYMGLDIGKKSIKCFKKAVKKAKTVIWNGTLGVSEYDKFRKGTVELAKFITKSKAKVIVGGGDSAAAMEEFGFADKLYHVSTGGGASLVLFEGNTLPAIEAIEDKVLPEADRPVVKKAVKKTAKAKKESVKEPKAEAKKKAPAKKDASKAKTTKNTKSEK